MQYRTTRYDSPLGTLILTGNNEYLLRIEITDGAIGETSTQLSIPLQKTIYWLDAYFAGRQPSPAALPLQLRGSAFQQEVWDLLAEIPYGQTVTYGDIAAKIAEKRGITRMSAQAVGQAVGANPIPIIIPCHRVVGASRQLVGYACGLDRKKWLLDFEQK